MKIVMMMMILFGLMGRINGLLLTRLQTVYIVHFFMPYDMFQFTLLIQCPFSSSGLKEFTDDKKSALKVNDIIQIKMFGTTGFSKQACNYLGNLNFFIVS